MRVAWPANDGAGGSGGGGEARASYKVVHDAGGVGWASGGDYRGVDAPSDGGVGNSVRVDLEVANDDEREGARAGVGADGGEDGEVVGAEAAANDEIEGVDDDVG